jgi:DNA-binding transcriptional MerR regulator
MADPVQTPPATPPANDPAPGGQPPANDPGKTLTQAEIDAIVEERLARDRKGRLSPEDFAKEFGMSLKDAKAIIKAKKEADEAQKTELEKLQGINQSLEGENKATKAELMKLRLAIDAQVPADKLSKVLKYVTGSTEDEIKASLDEVRADWGLIQQAPPNAAQGAGNNGIQPANNPKKIWTEKEIKELRISGKLTDELMGEIKQATIEGRVQ